MAEIHENLAYRQRLLAGLAAALEQKPLPALNTGDIVREAGVSKRTFYEHFANKEECFLELYRSNSQGILAVLRAEIDASGIDPLARIERGSVAYLRAMQAQAPLMKRLYIDILALGQDGLHARRHVVEQFAEMIEKSIEAVLPKGASRPAWLREVLVGAIAGLNELILYRIEDGQADRLTELAETSRSTFLGLIRSALEAAGSGRQ